MTGEAWSTRRFETFSYLPPLTDEEVGLQVRSILARGHVAGIEHAPDPSAHERYWSMWKLPLFGVTTVAEVLTEIAACAAEHPDSHVRVVGYDPRRQCQVAAFVVRRPVATD